MIPFPVLNKININEPPLPLDIIDLQTNYGSTYLLYNNGKLYGYGSNTYSTFGFNGSATSWTLLHSSIKRIVSTGIWSACFETIAGEFVITGRKYGMGTSNGTVPAALISFEPLSNFLPSNLSITEIKDVKCAASCIVLTYSGEVWGIGDNNANTLGYNVRPTYVTEFTKISNAGMSADAIGLSFSNSYIMVGTTLYGMGGNQYNGLGSPSSDPSSTFVQIASGVKDFGYVQDLTQVLTTSGNLLAAGYNFYGQTGTNTSGNSVVATFKTQINAGANKVILQKCTTNNNTTLPSCQIGTSIRSAGNANYNGLGNNYTGNQYSLVAASTSFITKETDVKLLAADTSLTYCITQNNEMWGWGMDLAGYTGKQVYPVKITLPL